MIVLDASAMVELLLRTTKGLLVRQRISYTSDIHVPHLLDVEVAHVLRRMVKAKEMDALRASSALEILRDMELTRYASVNFLRRIWHLRENLSAYDAAYVSLAEALSATLITCDQRLGSAPGHNARMEVF